MLGAGTAGMDRVARSCYTSSTPVCSETLTTSEKKKHPRASQFSEALRTRIRASEKSSANSALAVSAGMVACCELTSALQYEHSQADLGHLHAEISS